MSYAFIKTMRANPNQSYIEASLPPISKQDSSFYKFYTGSSKHKAGIGAAFPADSAVVCWWPLRPPSKGFGK